MSSPELLGCEGPFTSAPGWLLIIAAIIIANISCMLRDDQAQL